MNTTAERIARVLELRAKATPGKWSCTEADEQRPGGYMLCSDQEDYVDGDTEFIADIIFTDIDGRADIADAAFLASCHEACDLLALLRDECAALRADAERWRWLRDSTDCALSLSHNDHHLSYVPVDEELDRDYYDEVTPEQRAEMVAADSVWTLHIYPNTPVGFNSYSHATLDAAIEAARAAGAATP